MQLQLRSLEVFITVVEKKGFTKAAEALYVGQPALSKTIQKLEQELKVTLFDRSSKKIQLTDEGKVLYEKSKEILAKVTSIPESLHELSEVIIGEVRVGIPQIIGTVFFPQVAYHFLKKYPKVTLTTEEDGSVIIESLVNRGELDIGFVVLPASNTLDAEVIYQDTFVVCVSSKHPLAGAEEVSLSQLKEEKFILFDKSFALYNLIRNHCIESGFSPEVTFQSKQWDLVLQLVSAQLGITVIPKILANKLNDIDIVALPITQPKTVWNIGIITKKNAYKSYALKEFINVVREIYTS
ncbi:LysR family transcriptional regulator [Pueribacillus theae]|uniref:LysR family transcriptional regulator n=1 Tax=Pueribacillus theae TaxID=2171751 RepID=A0A2U1K470_9BACI|nr:LysR family transcriptional regulator [Pueribacillus theae]PWA12330.1 LysR family transcriptional regulator [Pueribacillus theae]